MVNRVVTSCSVRVVEVWFKLAIYVVSSWLLAERGPSVKLLPVPTPGRKRGSRGRKKKQKELCKSEPSLEDYVKICKAECADLFRTSLDSSACKVDCLLLPKLQVIVSWYVFFEIPAGFLSDGNAPLPSMIHGQSADRFQPLLDAMTVGPLSAPLAPEL
jgi:hypothetical protein